MKRNLLACSSVCLAFVFGPVAALGQTTFTKAMIGDLIAKVEDGIDDFEEYLEDRVDNARDAVESGNSGRLRGRRNRQAEVPEGRREQALDRADELEDSLDDLDRSTNRLRRRFRRVTNFLDTRAQVDNVVDDAREINQVVVCGNYATQVARIWAVLRVGINDLARAYGVTPLAIEKRC